MKTKLIIAALALLTAIPVFAQTATDTNAVAAQAAGQAVLDNIPGLSLLSNIPGKTFDQANFEVFAGLQNTGSSLNNALDLHYNIHTNFFVTGGLTLGATPSLVNSAMVGGGVRHAWQLWEVYGGVQGGRNFVNGIWEGNAFGGIAWKPSSGLAVYLEPSMFFDRNTFKGMGTGAPSLSIKTGICFAF